MVGFHYWRLLAHKYIHVTDASGDQRSIYIYICSDHFSICLFSPSSSPPPSSLTLRPVVESKNMRFQLLNEHRPVIGNTRAFDGSILYLPKKITDTVGTNARYCALPYLHVRCRIYCGFSAFSPLFFLPPLLLPPLLLPSPSLPLRHSHAPVLGRQMVHRLQSASRWWHWSGILNVCNSSMSSSDDCSELWT